MKPLLFSWVMLILGVAEVSYSAQPSSDDPPLPHVQEIVKILQPYVKTLEKDTAVFHWTQSIKNPHSSCLAINDEQTIQYAQSMSMNYERALQTGEMTSDAMGSGFYFSTDPFSSARFGGFLVQLFLKKGERVLDLFDFGFNVDLKLPTCDSGGSRCRLRYQEFGHLFWKHDLNLVHALKYLKIGAIRYFFYEGRVSRNAFSLISPSIIDFSRVRSLNMFYQYQQPEESEIRNDPTWRAILEWSACLSSKLRTVSNITPRGKLPLFHPETFDWMKNHIFSDSNYDVCDEDYLFNKSLKN